MLENVLVKIVKEHFPTWEQTGLGADFKTVVVVREMGEVMAFEEVYYGTNYLKQITSISINDIVDQLSKAI